MTKDQTDELTRREIARLRSEAFDLALDTVSIRKRIKLLEEELCALQLRAGQNDIRGRKIMGVIESMIESLEASPEVVK
jgi:hypothetical protein